MLEFVKNVIAEYGEDQEHLVSILHRIQEEYKYLPEQALQYLEELTNLDMTTIISVASFYHQFRFKKAGKHTIKVCIGTACFVKGAEAIYNSYLSHFAIPEGEDTDSEKLFTVEKVACLGCCSIAPAVQIDEKIYGPVDPADVAITIDDFLSDKGSKKNIELNKSNGNAEIKCCLCSSCKASGSEAVFNQIKKTIKSSILDVNLKSVSCTGLSFSAPTLDILDKNGNRYLYGSVTTDQVEDILINHFKSESKISHLLSKGRVSLDNFLNGGEKKKQLVGKGDYSTHPYLKHQVHIVTEYSGESIPLDIDEYRSNGGFQAWEMVQNNLKPENIIQILKDSGLQGRGGAGYPSYKKWKLSLETESDTKYVICNGDEGDPGAFMDRMILESYPLRVLEGMAIACNVLGVSDAILYIRNEYPLAIKRVQKAIEMSKDIFNINFRVEEGAGAFVCGEETALLEALEGRRGIPRSRPPYPSQVGLWGKPTLINNVETFASIAWIIRKGAESYIPYGSDTSKGTKLFALAGKINRGGLVEIPIGMTINEVVKEIGGGVPDNLALKAVQIGGPSGGCLPADKLDIQIDYTHLNSAGVIMGSGGLIVLDENDCMVDIARYFMEFTQSESCGKCSYCRIGTKKLLELLDKFCAGLGTYSDLEKLENLSKIVSERSMCGLGKSAPNPVLTTIRYFRNEYIDHIEGRCTAHSCKSLINYSINENCIGCQKCKNGCGVDAISGERYENHSIDKSLCIKCGSCKDLCNSGAVDVF